jgi:hypothetical protein
LAHKDHLLCSVVHPNIQWLKKLSQCFTVLTRWTWYKTSILHNILKIIYVILCNLGFKMSPVSCDLDTNWLNAK